MKSLETDQTAAAAPRPAGIVDVARLAGVSPATVSRSLRGLPGVSDVTRLRVLEAAHDLSYVASPAASTLASGRTGTIAVLVPSVTRWFFAQAVAGAEEVLREAGYDFLLYNLGGRAGRERFFSTMPLNRRVDAVMVLTLPIDDEQAGLLQRLRVPVVTLGTRTPLFSSVRIEESEAVMAAVRHLRLLGHESITMITGPHEELDFVAARERRNAVDAEAGRSMAIEVIGADARGLAGGAQATERILSGHHLPTAILAEYDEVAFGVLRTLRRAGVDVPGRVSVMGFDDHELASVVDLTTIAQSVHQQGEAAARLLLDDLHNASHDARDIVLPTRLVVRGTTAPPTSPRRL